MQLVYMSIPQFNYFGLSSKYEEPVEAMQYKI